MVSTEEEDIGESWRLRIIPETMYDEEAEDYVYLGDGREVYEQLHLRLSADIIEGLIGFGYTELFYEIEDAILIIPLDALKPEITVEGEEEAETVHVDVYDICLEQVDIEALSDEESDVLAGRTMAANAYRVSIIGEWHAVDAEGNTMPETLNVMDKIEGVRLCVMPFEDPEYEDAFELLMAADPEFAVESEEEYADETEDESEETFEEESEDASEDEFEDEYEDDIVTVDYTYIDECLYAEMHPAVPGMYAIGDIEEE
jgi:hypothetical protein